MARKSAKGVYPALVRKNPGSMDFDTASSRPERGLAFPTHLFVVAAVLFFSPSESFVPAKKTPSKTTEKSTSHFPLFRKDDLFMESTPDEASVVENEEKIHSSRKLDNGRRKMFSTATTAAGSFAASVLGCAPGAVNALEKLYPADLDFRDSEPVVTADAIRKKRMISEKDKRKKEMEQIANDPFVFFGKGENLAGSFVWAGALWLLSGSRSNPLVNPIANALYDEEKESWLKDRNEGLFAPLPIGLYFILVSVFLALGLVVDRTLLFLTEGDASVCLQIAGVSLIGGGSLELGRIASGEKGKSREEDERDELLEREFAEFAERRLITGGNCHRSEVVGAFRRFYAKYRVADNPEYPLSDLEIERLLRRWNRSMGNEDMSSAGFFSGIQINSDADVFVNR